MPSVGERGLGRVCGGAVSHGARRGYETLVEKYNPPTRRSRSGWMRRVELHEASFVKKKLSDLYVNNRLEGWAPLTISGISGLARGEKDGV